MASEHVQQLAFQHGPWQHPVKEIRTVERSDKLQRIAQAELSDDVPADASGRCRGVRVDADARQPLAQTPELPVLRPEIVSPLADAMRLVDGDEADAARREKRQEAVAAFAYQPFGRDVEE